MRVRAVWPAILLVVSPFGAARAEEDALRAAELARTVWRTVDAPEAGRAGALRDLEGFPGVDWREVHDVLAAPRPVELLTSPKPPRTDFEQHLADLAAFGWKPGVVRAYDISDQQPSWYAVTLSTVHDPEEPVAVLLDLGAFAPQAEAPQGWAVVRFHDHLHHATDLGGVPFSLTAGTASQCVLLSVLADLERRVRFDPDRVFVAGFSRGGNASLYFATHWPDLFAGAVPAAGYYEVEDRFLDNLDHVAVLAAWGDDRHHRAANAYQRALVPRLRKSGADVTPREQKGRATDGDFGDDFMAWARTRRRASLPRSFRYTLRDPRHRGAYWVEILAVEKTGGLLPVSIGAGGGGVAETFDVHRRVSFVRVEVVGDNEIRLGTTNVKRLRLHLSAALFDLGKPISVRRGKRATTHETKPSIATLVASFRRHRDRTRLFPAYIDLEP